MTDPRHRKPDRKRGLRLRRRSGRRRATQPEQTLSREELKAEARRRRERSRRRRIGLAMVAAFLIVWGAAVFSWWLGQRDPEEVTLPTVAVPSEGVSALLAVTDDVGVVQALALIAAHEESTGRVILVHPSLLTTLPGFGENIVSNAIRFDGEALLATTVTNLLGTRIDGTAVWTTTDLAAAVIEPVEIDLDEALIVEDDNAQVVVAGTGPAERDGDMVARLMTEVGLGDELDLMQRQGAVWAALLAWVAADAAWADALVGTELTPVRRALVAVAASEPLLTIIPATRLETSGGGERYQLDGADAAEFVSLNLPFLQLADEPRVRIEVLNGNGRIGTTQPVAALLVDRGYRVVVTDNADRDDYLTTQVIAQGLTFQEAAVRAREVLGLGDVSVEIRQPSGVVDLTIIVGEDLPAGEQR